MKKMTLAYALAFTITTVTSYPKQVKAAPKPPPPPDAPQAERGGGARPYCPITASEVTFTPLIPLSSWGRTINKSPTIWIHVSYASNPPANIPSAEFSLVERNTGKRLEPLRRIDLPKRSGIFSISLPDSLEINKWYRWHLDINCSSPGIYNSNNVFSLRGFIYPVEQPSSTNHLPNETPQERFNLYEKNDLWYDALNEIVIGKLYCANSGVSTSVKSLLKRENLDEIFQNLLICSE